MTTAIRTMLACLVLSAFLLVVGQGVPAASPPVSLAAAEEEPWPHCAGCIP